MPTATPNTWDTPALLPTPAQPLPKLAPAPREQQLEPLPMPAENLEDGFDWAEPPVVELEPGPSFRVRVVDGGELEPLPFPSEFLEGTEWEAQ